MTVPLNSRYLNSPIIRVPNAVGVYNLAIYRTVPGQTAKYTLYAWQPGDRPDTVAFNTLGNALLWWSIFDINPDIIDPLNVAPGTIVRIPTNPVTEQATLLQ